MNSVSYRYRPLIVFIFLILVTFPSIAQKKPLNKKLTVDVQEVKIDSLLDHISFKTKVLFSYNSDLFLENQKFTIYKRNAKLGEVLEYLLLGTDVDFRVVNTQIILYRVAISSSSSTIYKKVNLMGTVLDAHTRLRIEGAHIFVAGTLKGTVSNFNGQFEFLKLNTGFCELVISHVAYESRVISVELTGKNKTRDLYIDIKPAFTALPEIKVSGINQANWRKYLRMFRDLFIGKTTNAYDCEIMNPEVLDFTYIEEEDKLTAQAYQPIIIENSALGYRITYVLRLFESSNGIIHMIGSPIFEELIPANKKERMRWIKNRKASYYGSKMHFLRAMNKGKIKREGFVLHEVSDVPAIKAANINKIDPNAILVKGENKLKNRLKFIKYLLILYTKERPSQGYLRQQFELSNQQDLLPSFDYTGWSDDGYGQVSYLKLNLPEVTINSSGYIQESLAVTTYGYWAWERVAEYLPLEYQPN